MRKDLRDLFDQLAISYRSMTGTNSSPKVNGVKVSLELATSKKPQRIGKSWLGTYTTFKYFTSNLDCEMTLIY